MYDPTDNYKPMYAPRIDEFIKLGREFWGQACQPRHSKGGPGPGRCPVRLRLRRTAICRSQVRRRIWNALSNSFTTTLRISPASMPLRIRTTSTRFFYTSWWAYDDNGDHPDPWTMISLNTKRRGSRPGWSACASIDGSAVVATDILAVPQSQRCQRSDDMAVSLHGRNAGTQT